MRQAITKYLSSTEQEREQLRTAGYENARRFDWEKSAEAVIKPTSSNVSVRAVYAEGEPQVQPPAKTYPENISTEYSEKYHQVRFTWDKVEGADRYGIAVYLAGKWRIQTQSLTSPTYTTPKNMTPGKTYKVAVAARVGGSWDIANAVKNAVTVTVK